MIEVLIISLVLLVLVLYMTQNNPLKKEARFHDTFFLNFNEHCSNCGELKWVYEDTDYYYGKRMCLNCGLLQKGSHNPFLTRWDDEEYNYFDEGIVDNPIALALEWKAKNKYEHELWSLSNRYKELIKKKTVFNYKDLKTPMEIHDSHELIAIKKRFGELVYELKTIYKRDPEEFLFFVTYSQSEIFRTIKEEGYYPPTNKIKTSV